MPEEVGRSRKNPEDRKVWRAPEDVGRHQKAPENGRFRKVPEGTGRSRKILEGPGRSRKGQEEPGRTWEISKDRNVWSAPEDVGRHRKALEDGRLRKEPEGTGRYRKVPEGPGRDRKNPEETRISGQFLRCAMCLMFCIALPSLSVRFISFYHCLN